jgi:hypothetical protein
MPLEELGIFALLVLECREPLLSLFNSLHTKKIHLLQLKKKKKKKKKKDMNLCITSAHAYAKGSLVIYVKSAYQWV